MLVLCNGSWICTLQEGKVSLLQTVELGDSFWAKTLPILVF